MSPEAKEPGQRAYEAYVTALGDDPGATWPKGDAPYKEAWAAVEQACAVPAETPEARDWAESLVDRASQGWGIHHGHYKALVDAVAKALSQLQADASAARACAVTAASDESQSSWTLWGESALWPAYTDAVVPFDIAEDDGFTLTIDGEETEIE